MAIVFEFIHEGVCMCMHTVSSNILQSKPTGSVTGEAVLLTSSDDFRANRMNQKFVRSKIKSQRKTSLASR